MNKSTRLWSRLLPAALLLLAATASLAQGSFSGAIYTSKGDGTTVDQNIYDTKEDVYLNGGPQNVNGSGLPDGTYYFQVTTPNGVLLSTDPAQCRQLLVANGVVSGATGPCPHANGAFNPANLSTPVQLIPYDDTTNSGGEYKVWLIRQTATTTVAPDGITIVFQGGDTKTDNFKVKITTPPAGCGITCPGNVTVECGKSTEPAATGTPTVTGDCTASHEDFRINSGDCSADGFKYKIVRTWSVTGADGITASCEQVITVVDTTAPTLPPVPDDFEGQCPGDVPDPVDLKAADCEEEITASPVDSAPVADTEGCGFTITRTWTFTDSCGNTSSASQKIHIKDTTAPETPTPPIDFEGQCDGDVPPPVDLTAADNCSGDITVSPTDSDPVNDDEGCGYTITRTWTFTDTCGNTSSVSQKIHIKDTTAPTAPDAPADAGFSCPADVPAPGELTATDNCSPDITVTGVDSDNGGKGCVGDPLIITRTWTFTDKCGNTSSAVQKITVIDDVAPTVNCPEDVTVKADPLLSCEGASVRLNVSFSDCDPSATMACSVTLPNGDVVKLDTLADPNKSGNYVFPKGVSTVVCVATDSCGNRSTPCEVTITVNDCPLATRTIGFWATHLDALTAAVNCIGIVDVCNAPGTPIQHLEAILWGNISKQGSTKRTPLGQARMQLGQQLVAALANRCILGTDSPDINGALNALNNGTIDQVKSYIGLLDLFNNSGDSVPFTPLQTLNVGNATPQAAQNAAYKTAGVIDPGLCYK